MERKTIIIDDTYLIEYVVIGDGSKDLFCYHGFGETGVDMKMIAHLLADKDYRIIAPNFFFHGKSKFPKHRIAQNNISTEELATISLSFMQAVSPENKSYKIFGYSLGGKIALSLLEYNCNKIEIAILAAADGLIAYWWYLWFSNWKFAQRVFKCFIINPNFYFTATNFLMFLRILPKKSGKFSQDQMSDKENRIRIYKTWMALKKVHPKANTIGKNVQTNNTTVHFIMGKYDKVIPLRNLKRFLKRSSLKQHSHQHIILSGHNLHKHGRLEKTVQSILN